MNKKIKRLVAVALTISAFSAIAPATNINFMTTKAYASSKSKLTSLKVKGSGTIKLYESSKYKSSEKISDDDLEDKGTYYGKSTSDSIKITTSDDDYVRIFKGNKGYADGKSIPLSSGTTTLKVRLYDEKTSSSTNKDDDYVAEYTLKIKYTGDDKDKDKDDDDDKDYDDIYLDKLVLTADGDEIDFNFKKKTTSYNINVKESVSSIKVKAEPEDDDYKVKINGSTVDEDDKYRKTINLDKGKNEIKVKITDNGDERVYTLNVTRGSSSSNSNSNSSNSNSNTNNSTTNTTKTNQWVEVNGNWQYNDAGGNPVKNTWFYDRNSGQTYFLDAYGNMSTGWLYNNGGWYYLNPISNGTRGAKLTGWQSIGGTWYYLDSTGKMLTGWFKDMNGKWYYLQSSGAMAKNTTIGGYKLGSDGAWIR